MRTVGNIIWIFLGGIELALCWVVVGLLCYITIIGIPLGRQCMKFAALSFAPFGREIVYGGGIPSAILNVLWCLTFGLVMALLHAAVGLVWCATIIGIPFGLQSFKMAKLVFLPFGAEVR